MAPYFKAIALTVLTSLSVITSAAWPRIVPRQFTPSAEDQIKDGFSDAILLAEYAIRPLIPGTPHYDTSIFDKYFHSHQQHIVRSIFSVILGGIPNGRGSYCPDGAPMLGQIDIVADYERRDVRQGLRWICDSPNHLGGMRDHMSGQPEIVLCESVFQKPGFFKSYRNGLPAATCDNLGSRTSYNMDFFGATLLHEYLHWGPLFMPPLQQAMEDYAWGPWSTQELRLNEAMWRETVYNPDSYTYYALEALWTAHCGRSFGTPHHSPPDTPSSGSNNDPG